MAETYMYHADDAQFFGQSSLHDYLLTKHYRPCSWGPLVSKCSAGRVRLVWVEKMKGGGGASSCLAHARGGGGVVLL